MMRMSQTLLLALLAVSGALAGSTKGMGNRILAPGDEVGRTFGDVECRERLGGLLRYYYRKARVSKQRRLFEAAGSIGGPSKQRILTRRSAPLQWQTGESAGRSSTLLIVLFMKCADREITFVGEHQIVSGDFLVFGKFR